MKTMTCKQLGGACGLPFSANSFDEIAAMSKKHGADMFQKNDADHIAAMNQMKSQFATPAAMMDWFNNKRLEFDALPTDK